LGNNLSDKRRRKMNLILLMGIPAIIITILGVYFLVSEKKDKKASTPEATA
jgi:flagellar basal body-associated protein FliL